MHFSLGLAAFWMLARDVLKSIQDPMVDIHTHILPGVDDGARSWEMAIHMCHMASQDGTTHMVASPHSNEEYFYDRQALQATLDELSAKVGSLLTFSLGCDFHFSYENLERLEQDAVTFLISGTQYLLVELSDFSIPPWVTTKLQELISNGIQPIITHPERNMILQNNPKQVLNWAGMGCAIQVTANALTGRWGDKASRAVRWLFQNGAVHIIASDCHNVEGRSPVLSAARKVVEQDYGSEISKALFDDNPGAIIAGVPLPYFP